MRETSVNPKNKGKKGAFSDSGRKPTKKEVHHKFRSFVTMANARPVKGSSNVD